MTGVLVNYTLKSDISIDSIGRFFVQKISINCYSLTAGWTMCYIIITAGQIIIPHSSQTVAVFIW